MKGQIRLKKISIIGSKGSIGTQTLEVCDNLKDVQIMGLSANNNVKLAEEQIRKYIKNVNDVTIELQAHDEEENWEEITRQCIEARRIVDKVRK